MSIKADMLKVLKKCFTEIISDERVWDIFDNALQEALDDYFCTVGFIPEGMKFCLSFGDTHEVNREFVNPEFYLETMGDFEEQIAGIELTIAKLQKARNELCDLKKKHEERSA